MKFPGFTIFNFFFFTVVAAKVTFVKSSWLSNRHSVLSVPQLYHAQWAKSKNPETPCPDRGVMYKIENEWMAKQDS